jgi:excinuclease UvrABC nuclease subunit
MGWSQLMMLMDRKIDEVPERSGVYALEILDEVLYLGQSDNLRRSLREHSNSSDPCIKRVSLFRYYETPSPDSTYEILLENFKSSHNGKLPPCNELSS